jgi:hypothetical protein
MHKAIAARFLVRGLGERDARMLLRAHAHGSLDAEAGDQIVYRSNIELRSLNWGYVA